MERKINAFTFLVCTLNVDLLKCFKFINYINFLLFIYSLFREIFIISSDDGIYIIIRYTACSCNISSNEIAEEIKKRWFSIRLYI